MTTISPGRSVGSRNCSHVGPEALAVDRTVDDAGGRDAIMAQRGEEGHRPPVAVRHLGTKRQAATMPAVGACHVGLGPGLVDEHQAGRIDASLIPLPPVAPPRNVRPVLLAGEDGFF